MEGPASGQTLISLFRVKRTGEVMKLELRPACSDQLTPGKPVGVPSWVPSEWDADGTIGIDVEPVKVCEKDPDLIKDVERCFYFVVMRPVCEPDGARSQAMSTDDSASNYTTRRLSEDSDGNTMSCDGSSAAGSDGMRLSDGSRAPRSSTDSDHSSGDVRHPRGAAKPFGSQKHWVPGGSSVTHGDFSMPPGLKDLKLGTMIGSGAFAKGDTAPLPS